MIKGQKNFYQPVINNLRTYDSIRKIEIGKGDNYITSVITEK